MYFFNENFWLAACFFILVYFAYKPVKKIILDSLDSKISAIKNQLLEAESLKKDALLLLQQAEQSLVDIKETRQKMIQEAEISSENFIEQQRQEIESFFEKKSSETINAIENRKRQVYNQLKMELMSEVKDLVSEYFKTTNNSELTDIEIAKLLNSKLLKEE